MVHGRPVAGSYIKAVLFDPRIVCTTLIAGGLILLAVDEMQMEKRYTDIMDYPPARCA